MSSTIEDLMTQNTQGLSVLGYFTGWGAKDTLIERERVADLLKQNNLPHVALDLPKITTKKAISRALKEMAADRLVDVAADDRQKTVYVLVGKTQTTVIDTVTGKEQADLNYQTQMRVTFWKQADKPENMLEFGEGPGYYLGQAESEIRPLIEKYQRSYTSRDITGNVFLKQARALGAITIRDNGGMYFVGADKKDDLLALRTFAQALAAESKTEVYVDMYPVLDGTSVREDMGRHAMETIKSQMREVARELRKMTSDARSGKVESQTIFTHLQNAQAIQEQAEMFRDLLLLDIQGINRDLNALKWRLVGARKADDPFTPLDEMVSAMEEAEKNAQAAEKGKGEGPMTFEATNPFTDPVPTNTNSNPFA